MLKQDNKLSKIIKKYRPKVFLIILMASLVFLGFEYFTKYFSILKNPKDIKSMLISYKKCGVLAFFLLQIVQVVAFFVPGEIIQIAGGYIYGVFLGTLFSIIGITLGSIIIYYLANVIGKDFVDKLIRKKKLQFVEKALNQNRISYTIFFMYLIPGVPKDILGYICGMLNVDFKKYIIYSTLGRIPGILMSAYFGAKLYTGDKNLLVILAVISIALLMFGIINGEKIISSFEKNS